MRLVLLGLAVIACGGPAASGATCTAGAKPECSGASAALFCEGGKWVEFGCTGDLGCAPNYADAGVPFCRLPNLDAGSPCPGSYPETFGYCTTAGNAGDSIAFTCSAAGSVAASACPQACERKIEGQYITFRCSP